ncbi:uncharacterized protein TRAVEDRAFT_24307 [Trametes versicolor FP-101664 SS1]|uniref:uncharacterized protein n=1 Tax=Trametes versicolor (strain FP-101664) TaxID=717944 RepID=UPI0004622720|nr:uncharacterized protein TRAVEDRAFT_24307 [Trametes versicolor FP-101664 SS1]EIW52942.1 hypothetical protein TRAVEDRAFT_24307 [Trametes versicolor FP-101664 SS1]
MVSFAIVITAAIGRSMASVNAVKARRVAPVAAKVKSSISKIVSGHKPGAVSSDANRLRSRRSRAKDLPKRRPRESLPRVLAPLSEDIHTSLVDEIEEELQRRADADKASVESAPSVDSHSEESTLVGSDELKIFPSVIDIIAKSGEIVQCIPVELELEEDGGAVKDLVYSKEAFTASELALYEIKVVPTVVLPKLDYYAAAEGLVPLADCEDLADYQ